MSRTAALAHDGNKRPGGTRMTGDEGAGGATGWRAWVDRLDRAPSSIAVAVPGVAAAIFLIRWPFGWTGNQEQYLQQALQVAAPGRFGPWTALIDTGRERIVGFWTMGWAIRLFGDDAGHLLLELVSLALLALGIAAIARWLRLSALDAAAATVLFLLLDQTLMGGEHMIGPVEPKTIAHGLAMLGLAAAMRGRGVLGAVMTAAACYFHFLAAGLWGAATTVLLLVQGERAAALRYAATAALLCAPELALLVHGRIAAAGVVTPTGQPAASFIYSVLRAPHHVAPFAAEKGWARALAVGLVQAGAIGAGGWWMWRTRRDALRALGLLLALTTAWLFVAAALSWLDRDTGALGKFYLFRPAGPFLLLAALAGVALWRGWTWDRPAARLLPAAVLTLAFVGQVALGWPARQSPPLNRSERALLRAIRTRVPARDVVLLDPALDRVPQLVRLSRRQTLVHWKFAPTAEREIHRWYDLVQRQRAVFTGDCARLPAPASYLAVVGGSPALRCGKVIWSDGAHSLVRAVRR